MQEQHIHPSGAKVRGLTISALLISILGLLSSIVPFFGSVALIIGLLAFILSVLAYIKRKKLGLRNVWIIVALILSVIAFSFGMINYLNHQNAVNLILGVPGAESKLLIIPEESPLSQVVKKGSEKNKTHSSEGKFNSKENDQEATRSHTSNENLPVSETKKAKLDKTTMLYQKTSGPLDSYAYCMVDKLRVRSAPVTDSEVLGHLEFGEQVRFLGEKSAKMEKMMLAGKERNDYWYQVKSLKGFEITGWVYGGALIQANEATSDKLPGITIKPFNFISNDSLTALIGRTGYHNFTYSGVMTFKDGEMNNLQSDGRFFFIGFSPSDFYYNPGYGEDEEIRGFTKKGKLDGLFQEVVGLFESWIDLKITFKEGVCQSYKMVEHAEGDISESKSDNPDDCSFYAISDKLTLIN